MTSRIRARLGRVVDHLLDGPAARHLAQGALWSLSGTIAVRISGLATTVVLGRMLGRAGLGRYGAVVATTAMFQVFASVALGVTATKYLSQYRVSHPEKAGRIVALSHATAALTGGICAAVMAIGASGLARHALADASLAIPLAVSAVGLFFSAVNGAQSGAIAGLEAFASVARLNTAGAVASVTLTVVGGVWGGVGGAVAGNSLATVVQWALSRRVLRSELAARRIPYSRVGRWQEAGILWQFALPALLGGVLVTPVTWICAALIAHQPDGYRELGAFNAANQWFMAVVLLPSAIGQAVLPALSRETGAGNAANVRRITTSAVLANAVIVVPIAAVGALLSPYVMRLYGGEFADAGPILVAVLATAALSAIQAPVGLVIAAADRMWIGFGINLVWSIATVVLTVALLGFGGLGLALARLGAYAIHSATTLLAARSILATPPAVASASEVSG